MSARFSLSSCVIALAFVFHAAFFAWFPALHSPNELARIYLASALIEDGTVQIDRQVRVHGAISDLAVRVVDGKRHYYCDKAPGVALLSLPVLAAYDALASETELPVKVRLTRLWVSTLPTALLLFLLLRYLGEQLRDPSDAVLLVLAYALGSVATPYAMLAFGHQLSAVLLFGLFVAIRAASPATPAGHAALIGVCASLAVLVEYQNALLLVPFAVFYLARVRLRPRPIALAVLGLLPVTALLLLYHERAFGSPFATGYSFLASSFKAVHAQGLLGVGWPRPSHAFLSFLSPQKGLFFFAPWLALAVPGLPLLWRSRSAEHRFVLAFVVLYALFVSALIYPVGGWTVSQRHLVPAVPFMLLPAGLFVERADARVRGGGRVLLVGLALPALLACGISAVVWPHWQERLYNPFWQLGWPLFRDGWVVPSAGAALGIPAWWLAVVLLGTAAVIMLALLARSFARVAGRACALLAALAIAAVYIGLASRPGRDQNVAADRRFIERYYVADPYSAHAKR